MRILVLVRERENLFSFSYGYLPNVPSCCFDSFNSSFGGGPL